MNVTRDVDALERMLEFTRGQRRVPVIVDEGRTTIGFGGT